MTMPFTAINIDREGNVLHSSADADPLFIAKMQRELRAEVDSGDESRFEYTWFSIGCLPGGEVFVDLHLIDEDSAWVCVLQDVGHQNLARICFNEADSIWRDRSDADAMTAITGAGHI